jgi:hypothetical protein
MVAKTDKHLSADPVLAWLKKSGLLTGYTSPSGWVDIICPWHGWHRESVERTAGYKPIAEALWPTSRAFHCFHRSCRERTIKDFLKYVAEHGGPEVSSTDHSSLSKKFQAITGHSGSSVFSAISARRKGG